MMNKQTYSAPEVETVAIRFEEGILTLSTQDNTIDNATIDSWDDEL